MFPDCTLAIIAGGRATRLGGIVKAHLRLPDGRTILQRTTALLQPLVDDVVVCTSLTEAFAPLRTIPDLIPDRGAPGGVHAACAASSTEWVLAVGADMPFVSAEALTILWAARNGFDAVYSGRSADRPDPLMAFYRAMPCEKAFGEVLRDDGASFATLLGRVHAVFVPIADPSTFENVNAPEDVARLGLAL